MYPVYISESKVSFQGRPAGQGVFASRDINKGEVVDKGVFKHVDDCLETSKFVQKFCYTGTGPHFSKYIIFGYIIQSLLLRKFSSFFCRYKIIRF